MSNSTDANDYLLEEAIRTKLLWQMAARLTGSALLAITLLLIVSLATWSVDDPSLTHATSKEAANALGFTGASIADLLLQVFGLAAIALPLTFSIWAWRLMTYETTALTPRQCLYFLATLIALSAGLACCPAPQTWPLPIGLGGITGYLTTHYAALPLKDGIEGATKAFFALASFTIAIIAYRKVLARPSHKSDNGIDAKAIGALEENDVNPSTFKAIWLGLKWIVTGIASLSLFIFARKKAPVSSDENYEDMQDVQEHQGRFKTLLEKGKTLIKPSPEDGLDDYLNEDRDTHIPQRFEPSPELEPEHDSFENFETNDDFNEALDDIETAPYAEEDTFEDDEYENTKPAVKVQPMRVALPKARPETGKRIIKEAQAALPGFKDESGFELPSLHFLTEAPQSARDISLSPQALSENAQILEGVLDDFGVKGEIINVRPGPVVTLYELEPAPGIKSSRVIGLADDIARSMSAIAARVAVIPGKNAIGIELPNQKRETVYLHESLASKTFENNKGKLPICLGKTIGGEAVIADLARMPHLLVAGTTGSGKSVAINTMILSLLYRMSPEQCRLIMIDPKMLELSIYDGIPHLLTPVVTDPAKAVVALKWTVREMEDRYKKMSKVGVRNIDGFNARVIQAKKAGKTIERTVQTGYDTDTGEAIYEREEMDLDPLPFIVVIIDEMADLMMVAGKDIEGAVQRLAQMARAAGIHVIMATQRPSVDVITGTIKANFPTRISFQVTSKIDSRTILGEMGAEQLLGMGDMLYMAGGGRIQRVHGPFVSDEEVEEVVRHLKDQGTPQYLESITQDNDDGASAEGGEPTSGNVNSKDPYDMAVDVVLRDGKASTSYIQRRLSIGYNRAASIIERMEEEGIVGPANHAGKREILVGSNPDQDFG